MGHASIIPFYLNRRREARNVELIRSWCICESGSPIQTVARIEEDAQRR
jgi:hypothetical protein